MHESAAALRAWQARLLAWQANEPASTPDRHATRAAAYRELCKTLFDAARSQSRERLKGASLRLSLGQLTQLGIEGFDLEQIWAELETRNRPLSRSAARALKQLRRPLTQAQPRTECSARVRSKVIGATPNSARKRVRFAEERNETREFSRDQDEEVGCVSPNFSFGDEDELVLWDHNESTESLNDDELQFAATSAWAPETTFEEASSESESSSDHDIHAHTSVKWSVGLSNADAGNETSLVKTEKTATDAIRRTTGRDQERRESSTVQGSQYASAHGIHRNGGVVSAPGSTGTTNHHEEQHVATTGDPCPDQARQRSSRASEHEPALDTYREASSEAWDSWQRESPDDQSSNASISASNSDEDDLVDSDSSSAGMESISADSAASAEDVLYYADFFEGPASRRKSTSDMVDSLTPYRAKTGVRRRHPAADNAASSPIQQKQLGALVSTERKPADLGDAAEEMPVVPNAETPFERCEAQLRAQARALERFHLEEKPWQLRGEVMGPERPVDSALDAELDFDLSTARRPRIRTEAYETAILTGHVVEARSDDSTGSEDETGALTEAGIQARIRQRVIEQSYDDVARRIRPSAEMLRTSASALDTGQDTALERPSTSLSTLYAQRDANAKTAASSAQKSPSQMVESSVVSPVEQVDKLFDELSAQIESQTQLVLTPFTEAEKWSLRPQRLEPRAPHTIAMEEPALLFHRYEALAAPGDLPDQNTRLRDQAASTRLEPDAGTSARLLQGDTEASRSNRRTRRNRLKRLVRVRRRRQENALARQQQATEWLHQSALRSAIAAFEAKSKARSRHESRIAGEAERDRQTVYEQAMRVVNQAEAQAEAQARAQVDLGYHAGVRIRKAEYQSQHSGAEAMTSRGATSKDMRQHPRRLEPGDDQVQAGGGSGSAALYQQLRKQLQREVQHRRTPATARKVHRSDGKGHRASI
jgi:hypothetical protein